MALKIAELHGMYNIKGLAFDRWRVEDVRRELDSIGCNVELIPFGQGFRDMAPALDFTERLIETGKLLHGRHPVLSMCAVNAKAEVDAAGNRKLYVVHVLPQREDAMRAARRRALHAQRL